MDKEGADGGEVVILTSSFESRLGGVLVPVLLCDAVGRIGWLEGNIGGKLIDWEGFTGFDKGFGGTMEWKGGEDLAAGLMMI